MPPFPLPHAVGVTMVEGNYLRKEGKMNKEILNGQEVKIYTRFIELTPLTKGDRVVLRQKRGFVDDTIDEFQFRSGSPDTVKPALDILQKEFSESDLIESGLLIDDGQIAINKQLLEGRILIPYLDVDGETVYRIRPHKLGFKDKGIDIYCRYLLGDKPEHVVLTEAEFKAVAIRQLDIPVMAIPGVSSFAGQHFDRLVKLLKEFEVKSVTILFDNEDKSNPAFPNFKPDFRDRYDTDFWAYIMGYKLQKAGFETNIVHLPDDWRVNGKADCDSALSAGHTKDEFQAIIEGAVNCYKYVDNLPIEAQRVVRRKIDRYFYFSPLKIGFTASERNSYVWETTQVQKDGGTETPREVISNFHLKIEYVLQTSNGCLRRGYFINRYDEESEKFFLQPTDMASAQKFREFTLAKGNYLWTGSTQQLQEVWRYTFVHDDGAVVYQPDGYGLNEHEVWQFGNVVITGDAKIILPDDEDIFWVESNQLGFVRPQDSSTITDGKRRNRDESLGVPILITGQPLDIRKMLYLLRDSTDNTGGFGAWLGVGWIVASLHANAIVVAHHGFPIFFIGGKTGSGKSSFGRWLMSLVGSPQKEGKSVATTTDKGLHRLLAKYSNLPVWLGDFRNTAPESRIETFRNVYDRISYERAEMSNDYRTRSTPIRGTLLMDGEETPRDQALHSRCVVNILSEHTRGSAQLYNETEAMSALFPNFAFRVLEKRNTVVPMILDLIPPYQDAIAQCTSDARLSLNYAIVAAAFSAMVNAFDIDLGNDAQAFTDWVLADAIRNRELKISDDVITRFFETLNILTTKSIIQDDLHFKVEDDTLYLWFSGAFAEYELDEKRRGHNVFKQSVIQDYIKSEPYVVEISSRKSIGGKQQRCIIIDLKQAPEIVQTFAKTPIIIANADTN